MSFFSLRRTKKPCDKIIFSLTKASAISTKMSGIRACAALKELRIHLCQTGEKSQGVRDFITNHYVNMKKANPELPILVRECSGVQARVWARYDKGCELTESLEGLDTQSVLNIITGLAKL